ncbi:MAG: DedA family protein [Nanoarchaeota archaeon]
MIEFIVDWITGFISGVGYFGVFLLMVFESMVMPIPSEAVMPFAGYLVAIGTYNFWTMVVISGLASIAGSLISYAMGYYGGYPVVHRVGRFLFLNESHLRWTHRWFERHGSATIFISRFIPVVRHLISIPAGVAKMSLKKFVFYTAIGATMWNSFLLWLGVRLAEHWDLIGKYSKVLDVIVIVVIVGYLFFHFRHARKPTRK